jgi:predicted nuclease of restriction endonuclease-like RecB superfamily
LLPLDLLVVRTREGSIHPVFADISGDYLDLASRLIRLFKDSVGMKKGELLEQISTLEMENFDYRLVRGLSMILQRLGTFEMEAAVDSLLVRRKLFEAASSGSLVYSEGARREIICKVADQLKISPELLEELIYADLDDELVLKEFRLVNSTELLRMYNLSLTQTLLLRSTYIEVEVSDGWKEIFRFLKFKGLMYSIEVESGLFRIVIDGPLSLIKLTQRYGAGLAKLFPLIIKSSRWKITGNVVRRGMFGKRIYNFKLESNRIDAKIKPTSALIEEDLVTFDSYVEKRFFHDFLSLNSGWKILREPTPLVVGKHVFIPDFRFERKDVNIYLEIVGFWTQRYLENKIKKMEQLKDVDIIIAVNEKLACEKLRKVKGKLIFYKKFVPMKPVLEILRDREKILLQRELEKLDLTQLELDSEVVELQVLAEKLSVSKKALQRKLKEASLSKYTLAGDILVSNRKLQDIEVKIGSLQTTSLSKVIDLIEQEGINTPYDVLSALNYSVQWNGLDLNKSQIYKK